MTPLLAKVEKADPRMIGPEMLRTRLIAAAPTPLDASGELHRDGLRRLIDSLAGQAVGGVAVGTLLARGSRLSAALTAELLSTWREGLGQGRFLITLVGPSPDLRRPPELFDAALAMARQAAERGADVLLVDPPGAVRGRPDRDRLVLEYYSAIAQAGLPMILSYRREASGGIAYGPEVLAQLLARPEILGIEIATIDGIATFQQVEALVRELATAKLVVSGEERFLGYSLLCGADAAMVGMGCVCPELVLDLMDAHFKGDASRFLSRTVEIDRLARAVFAPPSEGVILRLLWALVHRGTLPFEAAHDPWGIHPSRSQFDRLGKSLAALDPEGPWQSGQWPEPLA